nr:MAG TPA: hypothetical protein [Bacteriophage sp.]
MWFFSWCLQNQIYTDSISTAILIIRRKNLHP